MITKEALDAIGAALLKHAPDHVFLVLLSPKTGEGEIAVVSNLERKDQPVLAAMFLSKYDGIKTGASYTIDAPTKSH